MSTYNRKKENSNKTKTEGNENIANDKVDNLHNGLKILAETIARDIYEKRKGNSSDKWYLVFSEVILFLTKSNIYDNPFKAFVQK